MRIFDCLTYSGEIEILTIRREELRGLDVTHVIVQSNKTFTGNQKVINTVDFANCRSVVVDDMPMDCDAWGREKFQRDAIMRGLYDADDDDLVIVSDADEIIRREVVENFVPNENLTALKVDTYRYYINCLEAKQNWIMPRIMKYKYLKQHTPDKVRNSGYEHMIENAGWHFSYLGGVDFVKRKIESFSHTELNTDEFKNKLEYKIENCQSLFSDDFWEVVDIDNTFPIDIVNNPEKYSHLIKAK